MARRPPPEPTPPPAKAEDREHAAARREQDERLRNAADRDVESGRNTSRSADDTRQSTD